MNTTNTAGSYKNWPLPVARGWQVKHESYTGSGTRTTLEFLTDDGRTGSAVIKGRPYEDGVVLYDPDTLQAYCVSQFRCAPRPDARGSWQAGLPLGVTIRVGITALVAAIALASPVVWFLVL